MNPHYNITNETIYPNDFFSFRRHKNYDGDWDSFRKKRSFFFVVNDEFNIIPLEFDISNDENNYRMLHRKTYSFYTIRTNKLFLTYEDAVLAIKTYIRYELNSIKMKMKTLKTKISSTISSKVSFDVHSMCIELYSYSNSSDILSDETSEELKKKILDKHYEVFFNYESRIFNLENVYSELDNQQVVKEED